MITVRLFGLLRIDHRLPRLEVQATSTEEVLAALESRGIPKKELKAAVLLVNGKPARKRCKLLDGDEVVLMSPVAGG